MDEDGSIIMDGKEDDFTLDKDDSILIDAEDGSITLGEEDSSIVLDEEEGWIITNEEDCSIILDEAEELGSIIMDEDCSIIMDTEDGDLEDDEEDLDEDRSIIAVEASLRMNNELDDVVELVSFVLDGLGIMVEGGMTWVGGNTHFVKLFVCKMNWSSSQFTGLI